MIRKPAVAGTFYPGDKKKLEETIALLMKRGSGKEEQKNRVKGLILPHAGYQYSGAVAAQTVYSAELKNTFIILGPNHTGKGKPFSVMTEGAWQTPLGQAQIDSALAKEIVSGSRYLKSDTRAHDSEHSIEVLIPFLQFAAGDIKFVPLVIARAPKEIYSAIAGDIVRAVKKLDQKDDVLLIASSDMTHYEPQESAEKKDRYAIEAINSLNAGELLRRVEEQDMTMCGIAPVVIMLEVVKAFGAKEAKLVRYETSGQATGDYRSVVGYAGMRVN